MKEVTYKMPENPNIQYNTYNNIKLRKLLINALCEELIRLSNGLTYEQSKNITNDYVEKLGFDNDVIIHKGITWCGNEILETLYCERKEVRKEYGIEEGI